MLRTFREGCVEIAKHFKVDESSALFLPYYDYGYAPHGMTIEEVARFRGIEPESEVFKQDSDFRLAICLILPGEQVCCASTNKDGVIESDLPVHYA